MVHKQYSQGAGVGIPGAPASDSFFDLVSSWAPVPQDAGAVPKSVAGEGVDAAVPAGAAPHAVTCARACGLFGVGALGRLSCQRGEGRQSLVLHIRRQRLGHVFRRQPSAHDLAPHKFATHTRLV